MDKGLDAISSCFGLALRIYIFLLVSYQFWSLITWAWGAFGQPLEHDDQQDIEDDSEEDNGRDSDGFLREDSEPPGTIISQEELDRRIGAF